MTRREIERMARDVVKAGRDQIEVAEALHDMEGNKGSISIFGNSPRSHAFRQILPALRLLQRRPCPRCKGTGKHSKYPQSWIFARAREAEKSLRMNI